MKATTGKSIPLCQVRANESDHQWDEGRETNRPPARPPGKAYTCSVCPRRELRPSVPRGTAGPTLGHDDTHHWHNCENANCPVTERTLENPAMLSTPAARRPAKQAVCETCGQAYGELKNTVEPTPPAPNRPVPSARPWAQRWATTLKAAHGRAMGITTGRSAPAMCDRQKQTRHLTPAARRSCIAKAECVTCGTAYSARGTSATTSACWVSGSRMKNKHWKEYSSLQCPRGCWRPSLRTRQRKPNRPAGRWRKDFYLLSVQQYEKRSRSPPLATTLKTAWQSDGDRHWAKVLPARVTDTKTAHRWS